MKKSLLFSFFLIIGIAAAYTACGGGPDSMVKGETLVMEGWVDEDTYQLAASGVPTRTLTNKVQRRESSKRAAILNAQYQVLEKFKGSKIEGAAGMSNFEMSGMAVAQEVQGVIKGGSVKSATFDEEDNCSIVYEVKAKGLQKKVQAADIQ